MSIRIILTDDHAIVRCGITKLIEQEGDMEILAHANNGRSAIELAEQLKPDVMIMDIGMPELNGIEATRQIMKDNPKTKIIALSMHSGKKFVLEMFKAGAAGYLLKDCAFEELITAIRAVISGNTYLSPLISDVVVNNYVRNFPDERSVFEILTQREREVVQLLSEGRTTKQIGRSLHISPKTVEAHRLNIMSKLNIDSIAKLTKYAIQEGLTLSEP